MTKEKLHACPTCQCDPFKGLTPAEVAWVKRTLETGSYESIGELVRYSSAAVNIPLTLKEIAEMSLWAEEERRKKAEERKESEERKKAEAKAKRQRKRKKR